jgi:hypothetical protein
MSLDTTTPSNGAVNQEEEVLVPQQEGETSQQAESQSPDPDANLLAAPEEAAIPEKYVGKSPAEIIKMHQEAERVIGRLGSEKGYKEREAEDLRQRMAQLEARFTQSPQPPQTQSAQPVAEEDPAKVFDKYWEENPKEAIQKAFETVAQRERRMRDQAEFDSNNRALASKYQEMKSKHSDFDQLEPVMTQMVQSLRSSGLVSDRALNRPEALEFLYKAARGENFEKSVETEAEKKAKKQTQIREQKKAAFSESGSSRSEATKAPSSMTAKELAAMIGYSENHWKR